MAPSEAPTTTSATTAAPVPVPAAAPPAPAMADVLDIRRGEIQLHVRDDVEAGLARAAGQGKTLPSMIFYNEAGLKLFEDITYLDDYYLTNAEIHLLQLHAAALAARIPHGALLVELGSGNLRKVKILLDALEAAHKAIDYYALDLSLSELHRTLGAVPPGTYQHVRCHGLHGTYDDGLAWLTSDATAGRSRCILSLGSSIGNFSRPDAAAFLARFAAGALHSAQDCFIIGLDGCQNPDQVHRAYNDGLGKTHEFYRNGLDQANRLLGHTVFTDDDWDVDGRYDSAQGRHDAFVVPRKDLARNGFRFSQGERICIEQAHKYSPAQRSQLFGQASLVERDAFTHAKTGYNISILTRTQPDNQPEVSTSPLALARQSAEYASQPLPTLADFEKMWSVWDVITREMIPHDELLSKPIKLRNCCLFYLGHIPAFQDIHLSRADGGILSEPTSYASMFERGIDPDVENPELCHAHSEVPQEWPSLAEILQYQQTVRDRVRKVFEQSSAEDMRRFGYALWLGLEHEAMHAETLLYMLLQSEHMNAPPGPRPDFEALARQAESHRVSNEWFSVPEQEVLIGTNSREDRASDRHCFTWDNERPARTAIVAPFEAQGRVLTNRDYALYLEATQQTGLPASWKQQQAQDNNPENGHAQQPQVNGSGNGIEQVLDNNQAKEQNSPTSSATRDSNNAPTACNALPAKSMTHDLSASFLEGKSVRTVYGLVPLKWALDWPVMASYLELERCARWMGGRIPTQEETWSLYKHVEALRNVPLSYQSPQNIPAVNAQLSMNGVEETPPHSTSIDDASAASDKDAASVRSAGASNEGRSAPLAENLFADLNGCNVGFQAFHPWSIGHSGYRLNGRAEAGGVWEWTSSVLDRWEGYEPMQAYPGYTADFFDGKHNVVLGGSWATLPRIAGRRSFVNFYQRNYPYAWVGARVVRDITSSSATATAQPPSSESSADGPSPFGAASAA